jgi:CMP-N,N'-diacetyllegionaminic acid synthase
MKILYLIPARGGSKGLPGKNIKKLGGKSLTNHAIDFARSFTTDVNICLSTDCDQIIESAHENNYTVPFIRPNILSTDTACTNDVLIHAINYYESKGLLFDLLVLLQPTTPFRKKVDLKNMINQWDENLDMMASVKEAHDSPYFSIFEENNYNYLQKSKKSNITRRQDSPKVYSFNGSLYLYNIKSLKSKQVSEFTKIKKYLMKDPIYSIDIDNHLDWLVAETVINNKLI